MKQHLNAKKMKNCLPDFYNIMLERHHNDPDGYDLLVSSTLQDTRVIILPNSSWTRSTKEVLLVDSVTLATRTAAQSSRYLKESMLWLCIVCETSPTERN